MLIAGTAKPTFSIPNGLPIMGYRHVCNAVRNRNTSLKDEHRMTTEASERPAQTSTNHQLNNAHLNVITTAE